MPRCLLVVFAGAARRLGLRNVVVASALSLRRGLRSRRIVGGRGSTPKAELVQLPCGVLPLVSRRRKRLEYWKWCQSPPGATRWNPHRRVQGVDFAPGRMRHRRARCSRTAMTAHTRPCLEPSGRPLAKRHRSGLSHRPVRSAMSAHLCVQTLFTFAR